MAEEKKNFDHLDKYLDGFGTMNEVKLHGLIRKEKPEVRKMVPKISEKIEFDLELAMSFCLDLLESVNFGSKALKEVESLFQKESKKLS